MGWATFNRSGYHVSDGESGAWLFFDDLQFGSLLEASKAHFSNPGQKKKRKRRKPPTLEIQAGVRGEPLLSCYLALIRIRRINQTLDKIIENPACKAAFISNFGVTPGELIGKGIVFGHATLLLNSSNTQMVGVTDFARNNVLEKGAVGSIAIQAFTIRNWPGYIPDTLDPMQLLIGKTGRIEFEPVVDANYTASDLATDIETTIMLRDAFVNRGDTAHAVFTSSRMWLSHRAFTRSDRYWNRNVADTPSIIVHELFHVAGIDKSIVDSQEFTNAIREHCRKPGYSNPIILRH